MLPPSRPPAPVRKPWPLRWIVLAILLFVPLYTWINLRYRKTTRPHEPAMESRQRAEADRLKELGWEKRSIALERVIDRPPEGARASVEAIAGGVPAELDLHLLLKPVLPQDYSAVAAPSRAKAGGEIVLQFAARLPDARSTVSALTVYRKGSHVLLLPTIESAPEELTPRRGEETLKAALSTTGLAPGEHRFELLGSRGSQRWTLILEENDR